jgi:photosystem II stability/assembly factor-like uncharacterized protein
MKKLLLLITLFTLNTHHSNPQWVQQTVPVSKPITGIKFIDTNTGWALSTNTSGFDTCHILYTSNGGTNWIIQYTATNSMYLALSVVDANTVYSGGGTTLSTANLTKTTNGGLNWSIIPTPTNMGIDDIQFLNKDSGWTCAGAVGADVRTTTNGGLNWIVRTSGIASQTQRIFFLNYNTGFCGANSFLYKTTDAGLNWVLLYNPSSIVNSIYFISEQTGWLGITNNRIKYTTNSGTNWTEQTISPPSGGILELYFINNNTGWAGVTLDYIFKTTNHGLNWGYQNVNTGSKEFCFVDSLHGWCGYLGIGLISKTTNGGGPIIYSGINTINNEIPQTYQLYQNYPNPFNPVTTIKVDISKSSYISFIIFDILGKEIYREEKYLKPGSYSYIWNAGQYSSGIYFYKLITKDYSETRKMTLIK